MKILYGGTLAQELRIVADTEIYSSLLPRSLLQGWDHDLVHGPGENRAPNDDRMPSRRLFECLSDLLTNPTDVFQIQIAIGLAWSADTNEREFGIMDGFHVVGCGTQPALLNARGDQLVDFSLDNGRSSAANQVDLSLDRINTDDFMTFTGQASRRHCADIPQSEDTDFQVAFLSPIGIGLEMKELWFRFDSSLPRTFCRLERRNGIRREDLLLGTVRG